MLPHVPLLPAARGVWHSWDLPLPHGGIQDVQHVLLQPLQDQAAAAAAANRRGSVQESGTYVALIHEGV